VQSFAISEKAKAVRSIDGRYALLRLYKHVPISISMCSYQSIVLNSRDPPSHSVLSLLKVSRRYISRKSQYPHLNMPTNTAAWLTEEKATHLDIKEAPYTSPRAHEILIKNGAMAIQPCEWRIQDMGAAIFSWLKYPCILGVDVAGAVVEVGSAVTRFKVGDRVLGMALGIDNQEPSEQSAQAGFQTYTILLDHMAAPIPDKISYESASVLPLGLSTAATGMFQKDYLALEYPSLTSKISGKALLVWGGATSVGSNAIQLGVAAGYEVITTASPKNFQYTKKLGASQVFDYSSNTVISDLIEALKDKDVAGAIECSGVSGEFDRCAVVLSETKGRRFLATVAWPRKEAPEGISTKRILGSTIKDNEVSKVIYNDFLPTALEDGKFITAPDPYVVGKGLEHVQAAIDLLRKGVSAKKIVVSL